MFFFDNRRVIIRNGNKTQTINVCSRENIAGQYDYIVRCRPTKRFTYDSLQQLGLQTTQELIDFLRKTQGCDVETEPTSKQPSDLGTTDNETSKPSSKLSRWDALAVDIVSRAIDQLVLDFVEFPYLYRTEHSLHCELFRILKSHTMFATTYPMNHRQTQCVHKEWSRRGTSAGGHIDLCVLAPDDLKCCSFRDFREGHLRPAIAIELGVDYSLKHLRDDERKVIASESRVCFLVHLVREHVTDNFEEVQLFLLKTNCKSAYARVTGDRAFVKLVSDSEIREVGRA